MPHKKWEDKLACARRQYAKDPTPFNARWRRHWENGGREKQTQRVAARKASDPVYALRCRISTQMCNALRRGGCSKSGKGWQAIVGYSVEDLKRHLEAQFEWWMGWENYGLLWQIDHIQPVISFRLPEEVKECWALTNLRPLQKEINLSKGGKWSRM